MLALGLRCLLAYLLGSLLGSMLVGCVFGGVDIRTQGSGNAGGTNALRTQGKIFALWVMLIDIGKGVAAAWLVPSIPLPVPGGSVLAGPWVAALCGMFAIVGHVFPVFYGFRGGKGAATYVGVVAVLAPVALLPGLAVFVLVLTLSGYVGLSTVLSACTVAVFALWQGGAASPLFTFALVMALFIVYTHRSNLQRLMAGNENRFERAMLLRKRR
ncbi:MAG TPA: glycerol-3-phosphate 1-O-acyltransferase PlsY [Gammaproteobacteria bacterium]|jgi:glycerol-3-phosphate acyltransferase PlsY|nr:glycerol-3-phosphate 1-O-acyltransferase PlsY [Gammaproteobacteria bacterium]